MTLIDYPVLKHSWSFDFVYPVQVLCTCGFMMLHADMTRRNSFTFILYYIEGKYRCFWHVGPFLLCLRRSQLYCNTIEIFLQPLCVDWVLPYVNLTMWFLPLNRRTIIYMGHNHVSVLWQHVGLRITCRLTDNREPRLFCIRIMCLTQVKASGSVLTICQSLRCLQHWGISECVSVITVVKHKVCVCVCV